MLKFVIVITFIYILTAAVAHHLYPTMKRVMNSIPPAEDINPKDQEEFDLWFEDVLSKFTQPYIILLNFLKSIM